MEILKQLAAALNRPDHDPEDIDIVGGSIAFWLKDDPYCFDLEDGTLTQYAADGLTVVRTWKVKLTIT